MTEKRLIMSTGDREMLNNIIELVKKSATDFYLDSSDFQKDLVLARQGIDLLLEEYAKNIHGEDK